MKIRLSTSALIDLLLLLLSSLLLLLVVLVFGAGRETEAGECASASKPVK